MNESQLDELGFQLSHDLKSSLRMLSLSLESASDSLNKSDFENLKQSLVLARESSLKLFKLIDGLTGISVSSRVKADENIEMQILLNSVISKQKSKIESKKLNLHQGNFLAVRGDSTFLEEVLMQLLSNAIEYSHGNIWMGSDLKDDRVVYFIEDDGPGVLPEIKPKLFYSLIKTQSTGLGLLFCRRVIERMGGKIGYERAADRSRFFIELPRMG